MTIFGPSAFLPIAVGFFGLGTCYLVVGGQALFNHPANSSGVSKTLGMWGIWMGGFMQLRPYPFWGPWFLLTQRICRWEFFLSFWASFILQKFRCGYLFGHLVCDSWDYGNLSGLFG